VEVANREATARKNYDRAMANLVEDIKKLTAPPATTPDAPANKLGVLGLADFSAWRAWRIQQQQQNPAQVEAPDVAQGKAEHPENQPE